MVGSLAIGACSSDATLRVTNNSDYDITELYLTQVDNVDYGENLLDSGALQPGDAITISVDCDTYDAKLVDEAGAPCELHAIDLCLNDSDWVIENDTCTAFQSAAKPQTQSTQAPAQAK